MPTEDNRNLIAAADEVNVIIDEYLEDYEFRGEDDQGRDGVYMPNDDERALITDAVHGLLGMPEFVDAFNRWQDEVRAKEAA